MNTLLITVSLFSLQSPAPVADTMSFNLHEVKAQIRSYLVDDVNAVSSMVKLAVSEGISASTRFFDEEDAESLDTEQAEVLAAADSESN
ncbi:hypothetical protein CWE12_08970 [Aliidiomarina sedimenti]|uniref:Uncharacterized protein n=1 Tax=Aliidiomarina sedimenti TaxID=1933879 RepID=A0ABY0BZN3_9GAMM|nr:hypothetical protein [Aliidiomarina sedimenti]RUO30079.1 hypothetical protein CWE12_08970 [Aliidiomarina sedimenti]